MLELKILNSGDIQFNVTDQDAFNAAYGEDFDDTYEHRHQYVFDDLCNNEGFTWYFDGDDYGLMFSGSIIVDEEGDRLWYDNYYAVRDAVDELLQGRSVVYTLYKD